RSQQAMLLLGFVRRDGGIADLEAGAGHMRIRVAVPPLLLLRPGDVALWITAVMLPGAVIVVELKLVNHDDALWDWTDDRALATANAVFIVDVVQLALDRVEAFVRAVEPAQRAPDAEIEPHNGAQGLGRAALEVQVARLAARPHLEMTNRGL